MRPPPDRTTDLWADQERVLPLGSAEPGQWRSERTRHMTPIVRTIDANKHSKIVAIMGSQMAKTESLCNCMGRILDDAPTPILYIAPTKSFIEKTFEPRFVAMVDNCEALKLKKKPGKREPKTMKVVSGVKTRFAWAGSATELSGEPACKVFVDERDRMDNDVGGEGDPVELADARHFTYADGQTIVTSTPTEGNVETEVINGLEFFTVEDDVISPTWSLFQQGTRHHWAVPCQHCKEYFIPKFKNLWWPEGATPERAQKEAGLCCPNCGSINTQDVKDVMYAKGVFVAPGQKITKAGKVTGPEPESLVASYWVSGLFSPFVSWGDRAAKWLNAVLSGEPEKIQAVLNTNFGELYSVAGEAPELSVIHGLKLPYKLGDIPDDVLKITCGVDVQKSSLYYSIRGWGNHLESWQIDYGQLIGETNEPEVWDALQLLIDTHYGNKPIDKTFIDSGYRTQFVYEFCRKNRTRAFATKGRDHLDSAPLTYSKQDVNRNGKRLARGLSVWLTNTDYFKRWLHERFERKPELPGGWHLPEDVSEEFCKAMVSEARVVKPSGRPAWVLIHRNNHYFDCEVNNLAAAYSLNLQMVQNKPETNRATKSVNQTAPAVAKQGNRDPFRNGGASGNGGWFGK